MSSEPVPIAPDTPVDSATLYLHRISRFLAWLAIVVARPVAVARNVETVESKRLR